MEQMSATATTTDMPTTKRKFAMFQAPNRPIAKVHLKDVQTTELRGRDYEGNDCRDEPKPGTSRNIRPQTSNVQETLNPQKK